MGKWTRRAFISTGVLVGGGVIVGVAMRPGRRVDDLAHLVEGESETLVHAFVKIDNDNTVTAIIPHGEMGQGAQTALAQMVADELDADWESFRFEEAPAVGDYSFYPVGRGLAFQGVDFPDVVVPTIDGVMMRVADSMDMQITGGSMSVRVTGMYSMRVAGAATREMLRQAAADSWRVPVDEITTENSRLIHAASSKSATYAEFASAAAEMTPSYTPALKDPRDYKIMGQSVARFDIPAKVDGTAMFALDVRRPGMVYATVVRAPVFGAGIQEVDDSETLSLAGVLDVVTVPASANPARIGGFSAGEGVAVVADSYWTAQQGLRALAVEWEVTGNESVTTESIFDQFEKDVTAEIDVESDVVFGDAEAVLASADTVIEADYRVPYLAHTCMEPLNATAEYKNGRCDVWVGCQNPLGFSRLIAESLGIDEDNVTVHNLLMGGAFGRKSRADWAIQAAHIARAVGRPVQMIWSREEDVRQDFYRPASHSRFKAALNDSGDLLAWKNRYTNKFEPVEAPLIPYAVDNQDIGYVVSPAHVPTGAWRSVDHSQHGFYTESFIDEVAIAAGKDPFEYRAQLLKDRPRHLAVLQKAADEAGWGKPLAPGRGRGISLQESFGSIVAEVVEVTVVNGHTTVDRVVGVVDLGFAISPDGTIAQMESGIVYGLTAALYGEITIENGAAKQGNYHDYQALRIAEMPLIETHIINSGHHVGGAGEVGTPGIAPALVNAIYDATGVRVRQLPLENVNLNALIERVGQVA